MSNGIKQAHSTAIKWDDPITQTLLRVYEEQWVHIKKGNLRSKDWEDLTFALNKEVGGSFNHEQARDRIDTIKKQYKRERQG